LAFRIAVSKGGTGPLAWPKIISPGPQSAQPKAPPLTRIEKETLNKLSQIFGTQVYVKDHPSS
jgi:hypothetical protein